MTYTTAFGAVIDDEIAGALRSGMPIEQVYAELAARIREVQSALVAKYAKREDDKCYSD